MIVKENERIGMHLEGHVPAGFIPGKTEKKQEENPLQNPYAIGSLPPGEIEFGW